MIRFCCQRHSKIRTNLLRATAPWLQPGEIRRWRELDAPKVVIAHKFERQADILVSALQLPINYARPRALASLGIQNKYFVSDFHSMVTNDAAAVAAQHGRFRRIVLDIAAGRLPTESDGYASRDPSASPGIGRRFHSASILGLLSTPLEPTETNLRSSSDWNRSWEPGEEHGPFLVMPGYYPGVDSQWKDADRG